jgi:hypothetical protein
MGICLLLLVKRHPHADRDEVHVRMLDHFVRAREFNRVRDLVAEGYVGKVLSCKNANGLRQWLKPTERSSPQG